jgi:hypothetical protein
MISPYDFIWSKASKFMKMNKKQTVKILVGQNSVGENSVGQNFCRWKFFSVNILSVKILVGQNSVGQNSCRSKFCRSKFLSVKILSVEFMSVKILVGQMYQNHRSRLESKTFWLPESFGPNWCTLYSEFEIWHPKDTSVQITTKKGYILSFCLKKNSP